MNKELDDLIERVAGLRTNEWILNTQNWNDPPVVAVRVGDRDALIAELVKLREQLTIERQATSALRRKLGDIEGHE
jgi:hypothetical protein